MNQYDWKVMDELHGFREFIKKYMVKHNMSYRGIAKEMNMSTETLIWFMNKAKRTNPHTTFKIQDWVEKKKGNA
jgi:orotate phosphoribosyltransferase-like protein